MEEQALAESRQYEQSIQTLQTKLALQVQTNETLEVENKRLQQTASEAVTANSDKEAQLAIVQKMAESLKAKLAEKIAESEAV